MTDPLIGRVVDGRYEVVSRIARGGMATVYLAVDRRLDRDVALKVMHAHLAEGAAGADFLARFRREARAAARLTHPGLVSVFDQGLDGETSYLTMEYVDGANLRRHLGEQGALTVDAALSFLESVLDALAAAHRAGLVHRDIKPENVLLAADGRVKVADFGLARAVTEVTATTTGTVFGTVAYLAPELVARGVSDARTDVYACGVLLYEMLTGRQPYVGETAIQVAFQHVNSDIPAPSAQVPWLPQELDDVVGSLAAREPDDRPADAAAALELVRRVHAGLDPQTLARRASVEPSITLPEATADPIATDEETTALTTEARGTTVALPIGAVSRSDDPPPDFGVRARHARRPGRAWLVAAVVAVLAAVGGGSWWFVTSGPGAYTTVPTAVTGTTQDVAEQMLHTRGLTPNIITSYDDVVEKGHVIRTQPEGGEQIRKDGTVDVTVSLGIEMKQVPNGLVGATEDAARAALAAVPFEIGDTVHTYHDTVPRGQVMALNDGKPIEGTQQRHDLVITLTVSDGPAPVSIPSVTDVERSVAEQSLSEAGLRADVREDYSDTVPAGTVIDQSPASGAPGHRTDTVAIVVSKGPAPVTVPDLFRMDFEDAQKLLVSLGLNAERKTSWGGYLDNVRAQSVKAGDVVPRGTTIVLTVV